MTEIRLKGMTWSHPRGYDPMLACSTEWHSKTGIVVEWDKRSLQDFESFPVKGLARQYDLIVIDHPHVGQITEEGCLVPLDVAGRETELRELAASTVGRSFPSYNWQGHQWAFPIDAAAQVQAFRNDLIGPCRDWQSIIDLARQGSVLLPLRPPHTLMTFYTLCANLGSPCASAAGGPLVNADIGETAFAMMTELASLIDPVCFEMDPIAVSEQMSAKESRITCSPYIYGYVNYGIHGFRPHMLTFMDIPIAGNSGYSGSALGGTGIAVSAMSAQKDAAIDFAYWLAGAEVQSGPYAAAGGQPGHLAGWLDDAVNARTGNFYRNTLKTLEGAWVRPRHNGYMAFQQQASDRINTGLKARENPARVVAELNHMFEKSA